LGIADLMSAAAAAPQPVRYDPRLGKFVEAERPNPMRVNRKEVAKRRKHRKEVKRAKRRA
jgi:hypothetical protein